MPARSRALAGTLGHDAFGHDALGHDALGHDNDLSKPATPNQFDTSGFNHLLLPYSQVPKLDVAGSIPVSRSIFSIHH
jgi:hypothetical protein